MQTKGYAAAAANQRLEPFSLERRPVGPEDVHIKIKFCGVCHSDLHQVKNEWGGARFPLVPGHEIVGFVEAVGTAVTKFKRGDAAAVGCLVDSCRNCRECAADEEQHCEKRVPTYNGIGSDGKSTFGGYSQDIVVAERFVCRVPDSLKGDLAATAPLLCAGITTWTPIKQHGMDRPGMKVGVIGLGGLGHMAVQFIAAFGNEVSVVSRSETKKPEAMKLGAKHFVLSTDPQQMAAVKGSLDFIIDTVCAPKDMSEYLSLLRPRGLLVTVAAPPTGYVLGVQPLGLIIGSKGVLGSLIGGLKATQDMLDFCGEKGIKSMVEVIKAQEINEAFERMVQSDVKFRFVIDIENSAL